MMFLILLLAISCASSKVSKPLDEIIIAPESKEVPGHFETDSDLEWLQRVVQVSNCVKSNPQFYVEVSKSEMLSTNGKSGEKIASEIKSASAKLSTYSKWTFYKSKELATYSNSKNEVLYRIQTNPREMSEMVGTAFHESAHLLGYFHNYNGNSASGLNLRTVPYIVGSIAIRFSKECGAQ